MRILKFMAPDSELSLKGLEPYIVGLILILSWFPAQKFLQSGDVSIGVIDPGIWMLVLLSLICFVGLTGISYWLVKRFSIVMGLPSIGGLIVQFNTLEIWQQLSFYWGSFALLLLAGVGALSAIL